MKTFLIKDKLIKIDDEDFHLVENYTWCLNKGNFNRGYYVIHSQRDGKRSFRIFLHRLIVKANPGDRVSFVNGNTLDLQKRNLRKNGALL